jgi:hypothetical protein
LVSNWESAIGNWEGKKTKKWLKNLKERRKPKIFIFPMNSIEVFVGIR